MEKSQVEKASKSTFLDERDVDMIEENPENDCKHYIVPTVKHDKKVL